MNRTTNDSEGDQFLRSLLEAEAEETRRLGRRRGRIHKSDATSYISFTTGSTPFNSTDHCVSALAQLSRVPFLWETICSMLSGDAIWNLAKVRYFKRSTTATPAWVFLSGLTENCDVVTWDDPDNVMSESYEHHFLSDDRKICANQVALALLKEMHHPVYEAEDEVFTWRGPARPSSPVDSSTAINAQTSCRQPDECPVEYVQSDHIHISPRASPAVFGIEEGIYAGPVWPSLVRKMCNDDSDRMW